jgi:hypothetical protein
MNNARRQGLRKVTFHELLSAAIARNEQSTID